MLSIVFVTFFLWFLFASTGYIFFYLLRYEPRNPFLSFFIGLFIISLLAMLVSLFMPLNVYALLLCFTPSLFGAILLSKRLYNFFHNKLSKVIFATLGIFIIVCIFSFAASYAAWPSIAYDTDLYHMQIVRWLNEYGTVPGVGNLHSRLANSSVWLIVAALLNHFLLQHSIAWYMMPLFLSAFATYYLCDALYGENIYTRMYSVCILPICIYAVFLLGFPNLYHDFPSLATTCVIGSELIRLLYSGHPINRNSFICVSLLTALAFLIKPLPVATVLCVTVFVVYLLHRNNLLTLHFTFVILALPFCSAVLWCIRNSILSGYPMFPFSAISLDVDWRMIKSVVVSNSLDVRAWARMPGPHYIEAFEKGITFWFAPWLHTIIKQKILILQIVIPLGMGSICWFLARKSRMCIENIFFFIWPTLSIIYWFWLAPDPRFGSEYFWLFFALAAVTLVRNRPELYQFMRKTIPFSGRCIINIFVTCVFFLTFLASLQLQWRNAQLSNVGWIKPGIALPRPVMTKKIGHSGRIPFTVYTTVDGDDRCGNARLPCTPYINPNLEMRIDGNLEAGFRIRTE